jgi:hypothetical protein
MSRYSYWKLLPGKVACGLIKKHIHQEIKKESNSQSEEMLLLNDDLISVTSAIAIFVLHNKHPLTVLGYDLTLFGLNFLHVNKRERSRGQRS